MKRIAITGGIGAGKSSVSDIIRKLGYTVIDCDALSREVTAKGSPLLSYVERELGSGLVDADGNFDRKAAASLVFSDREKYLRFNRLVQTAIKIRMMDIFYSKKLERRESLVFAEVPLLFEASWQEYFDEVILVTADESVRIERVRKRSDMTEEQVRERMARQMPDEVKMRLSDHVIDNSKDPGSLGQKVAELLKKL